MTIFRNLTKIWVIILMLLSYANGHAEPDKKSIFDHGVKALKEEHFQEAVDFFSELIVLSPDDAKALKNRGVAWMNLGNMDSAIADFQNAIRITPELKGIHSNLGAAWHYKGEYEKAITAYDLDIMQNPNLYISYFNRALSKTELNRIDSALMDIDKALQLKPDFDAAVSVKNDLRKKLTQKADGQYTIQTGAFLVESNAVQMKGELISKGYEMEIIALPDSKKRNWYLVRHMKRFDRESAQRICADLKQHNFSAVIRPAGEF
jgi:tetratricopeptide (TPR) repeat protein